MIDNNSFTPFKPFYYVHVVPTPHSNLFLQIGHLLLEYLLVGLKFSVGTLKCFIGNHIKIIIRNIMGSVPRPLQVRDQHRQVDLPILLYLALRFLLYHFVQLIECWWTRLFHSFLHQPVNIKALGNANRLFMVVPFQLHYSPNTNSWFLTLYILSKASILFWISRREGESVITSLFLICNGSIDSSLSEKSLECSTKLARSSYL